MVSNADVSLDFNLASFFVSPIFEFFNTIGQTLPSDVHSANDCSRAVSGSLSVRSHASAQRR